ncbi:cellobiose dehydrogenase [Podospora conica]|nr:cellobiose dehydrogenase [Schizothecium conicum]
MKLLSRLGAVALLCLQQVAAQTADAAPYKDAETGIVFKTWSATGANAAPFTFGLSLPSDALEKDATEYIGLLRCQIANNNVPGYCGISHGSSGQMTQALLLMAWPFNGTVYTSFRYTTGYNMPLPYTGNATLTPISQTFKAGSFELIYRCQGCFAWDQEGSKGSVSTKSGSLVIGRAAAKTNLHNPSCPDKAFFGFHDNGFGQFGVQLDGAQQADYAKWATAKVASAPVERCTDLEAPPAEGEEPVPVCKPAPAKAYDYIVVGSGAGGIPVAERLTAAGKTVLLIEKGPPSSGRYGGTMKPEWLQGTNLTRFDVPGLCNQLWVDSAGIACTDTDQMAGCVLGGGTAVNAALWWKPPASDWDENFPEGWKSADVAGAVKRAFERIPGTHIPSMDGKLYRQEGFNVLAGGLTANGYKEVIANEVPNEKNRTFGHSTFMYANGERQGPLHTYLLSALGNEKFGLWMNTAVRRAVRTGSKVSGVELECLATGGYEGTVNINPGGGVIFAAGAFGSMKLLLRSGIGPADQLAVVAGSKDKDTFIAKEQWIDLPVGSNLIDHLNTDLIVDHPNVVFYDFYEAWTSPPTNDRDMYLKERSGILAMSAPNIGPLIWETITPADGKPRQFQWTARVEGNDNVFPSKLSMTLSQYLGRGVVSRGRATITGNLDTAVSEHPYLRNAGDKEAVIAGIEGLVKTLATIKDLTFILPPANITIKDWVDGMIVSPSNRRSNHWMGTAKLGTDDGRKGGTSVVDLDTKVYGTDNLFVVDASIFPGMTTGNPTAAIVIAAERAAERILALK